MRFGRIKLPVRQSNWFVTKQLNLHNDATFSTIIVIMTKKLRKSETSASQYTAEPRSVTNKMSKNRLIDSIFFSLVLWAKSIHILMCLFCVILCILWVSNKINILFFFLSNVSKFTKMSSWYIGWVKQPLEMDRRSSSSASWRKYIML